MTPTATVSGATDALALGRIRGSGSVAVSATGQNRAVADAVLVAVSILGGGAGLQVTATVTQTARILARLASAETVVSSGGVLVSAAEATDGAGESIASAKARAGSGGGVSGAGFVADALFSAPVTAELQGTVVAGTGDTGATASSHRSAISSLFAVGVSGLGVSVSRARALILATAATTARVWNGTVTTGGAVVATAVSTQTADVDTDTIAIALGGASVTLPTARISAATTASLENPTTSVGGRFEATSHNHATVDANFVSITGVGFSDAGAVAVVDASAKTEATVLLAGQRFDAGAGDVTMTIGADNLVHASVDQGSGGGLNVNLLTTTATLDALTRGYIAAGTAVSRGFSLVNTTTSLVEADVTLLSIAFASGSGLKATAVQTGNADTIAEVAIGGGGLTASGTVVVSADATNTVHSALTTQGGSVIRGESTIVTSEGRSATRATFDGSVLDSTGATVSADADNTATADLTKRGGSLAEVAHVQAGAQLYAEAETAARFGTGALVVRSGGDVLVSAEARNTTNVTTDSLAAGLVGVGAGQPTSQIDNPTTAEFQGRLSGGATVGIRAVAANTATIRGGGLAAGLVGVSTLQPLAKISSTAKVTATLAAAARISSPLAAVSIRAESRNTATARAGAVGAGFVGVDAADPKARIENLTAAYVWGDIRGAADTVPGAKSLEVVVAGIDLATATLSSTGGGVVRVGTGSARAEVDSDVTLELGRAAAGSVPAGVIVVDGAITLTANQTPGAVSATESEGGGAGNVDTNSASVSNTPDLRLEILDGTKVTATGSIALTTGYNVNAPAVPDPSRYFQGVDAGTDRITLTAKHGFSTGMTVTYTSGGGAVTGGLAEGLAANVIVVDEYTIMLGSEFEGAQVDAGTNVIRFGRTYSYTDGTGAHTVFTPLPHGFTEGQRVVYRANGASIPGLVDVRAYLVHVVDDTGIQLFDPNAPMTPLVLIVAHIDDTADPDDPDDPVDTIGASNSYTDGQIVIYHAPAPAASFQGGYVDLQVDAGGNLVRNGTNFVTENNDTIYLGAHGFATGTEIVYSSGTAAPIPGLVNGAHYWVIRVDANRIRLADSYCRAMGAAGGAVCIVGYNDWDELVGYNDWDETVGTDGNGVPIVVHHHDPIYVHHHDPIYETVTALPISASVGDAEHKLFRMDQRPIDGLVDGGQYYVINASADSFQVSATKGGPAIDISVAGRWILDLIGSFVSVPVDLDAGTGTGRLVLDLGAFGSSAEKLTPIGASEPVPAGSYTTSATVRSSGGGAVNVGKARTSSYVDADIDIIIGAGARITSGADEAITDTGSFTITTDAYGDSQALSTNGGGGLVSVGNARAESTVYVDTVITNKTGAVLTSGWDLVIRPVTRGNGSARSRAATSPARRRRARAASGPGCRRRRTASSTCRRPLTSTGPSSPSTC